MAEALSAIERLKGIHPVQALRQYRVAEALSAIERLKGCYLCRYANGWQRGIGIERD